MIITVPTEILFEIATYLSCREVVDLLKTCRAMHHPLDDFLLSKHKHDILIYAAGSDNLPMLKHAISAGADLTYYKGNAYYWGTALHIAAYDGYTAIITEILLSDPVLYDPDLEQGLEQRDRNGNTALLIAALEGHQAAVDLLLAAGSDPDATGNAQTLLVVAIQMNLETTALAYIDQMDEDALHEAMEQNQLDLTRLMFARGIASFVSPPLGHAVRCGLEYVKLCVTHGADVHEIVHEGDGPPMAIAAFNGAIDVIEYLLENGANPDIDPRHQHPLTAAACAGRAATVKKLLAHGIDLVGVLNSSNHLMTNVCQSGSGEVVGLLLDAIHQVDMTGVVNMGDLLHTAVLFHKIDVITVLLERGANVNGLNQHEQTPLSRAVRFGYWEVVKELLKGGADAAAEIDVLGTKDNKRIRRLLRQLGRG